MGRGSSKAGGGSGGSANSVKTPFSATDWRTWPIGTEVELSSDDVVAGDGIGGRGVTYTEKGTVTAIYNDHVIVTMPDGTNNWIDSDLMDVVKSAKKR